MKSLHFLSLWTYVFILILVWITCAWSAVNLTAEQKNTYDKNQLSRLRHKVSLAADDLEAKFNKQLSVMVKARDFQIQRSAGTRQEFIKIFEQYQSDWILLKSDIYQQWSSVEKDAEATFSILMTKQYQKLIPDYRQQIHQRFQRVEKLIAKAQIENESAIRKAKSFDIFFSK